ncbi:MAG: phospholipase D-like domain-containing protein [Candidatus Thermoplasmatota archaeon]|nr:phospholipase D-like domain-containing protein [Candidatus Thermoplasmatota archaeon]
MCFRKGCAGFVIFTLLVAFLPVCASAEGAPVISVDFPKYIPGDGTPFWVSIYFSGEPNSEYNFGAWIYGGKSSITKLWNGTDWRGGFCYFQIETDAIGNWNENIALRISVMPEPNYSYYLKLCIKNGEGGAVAERKIRNEGNFSIIPAEEMGFVEGYAERDGIYISGEEVCAYDSSGALAGRCISERNGIEDYSKFAGYFRLALPSGNYNIKYNCGEFCAVSVAAGQTVALNNRSFSYPVHNVATFVSPDCSFDAISSAILSARESICLNIYEFTNPFLYDCLAERLNDNVSLRIIVEKSPIGGMKETEKWMLGNLQGKGAEIRFWQKPSGSIFDHAKYMTIDNNTAIVESANWGSTGIPTDNTFGNREWGIVVRDGAMAQGLLDVFNWDWEEAEPANLSGGYAPSRTISSGEYEPKFRAENFNGNFSATFVFSPETSLASLLDLIRSAKETLYIEQLYIYRYWDGVLSPLMSELANASARGVDVKIILNYNPEFEKPYTANSNENAANFLKEHNISVKLFDTELGIFANVHNKGTIADNRTVLVSSINWNENSVCSNREFGIILENENVAKYYADVFFYDWRLADKEITKNSGKSAPGAGTACIILAFSITILAIGIKSRCKQ